MLAKKLLSTSAKQSFSPACHSRPGRLKSRGTTTAGLKEGSWPSKRLQTVQDGKRKTWRAWEIILRWKTKFKQVSWRRKKHAFETCRLVPLFGGSNAQNQLAGKAGKVIGFLVHSFRARPFPRINDRRSPSAFLRRGKKKIKINNSNSRGRTFGCHCRMVLGHVLGAAWLCRCPWPLLHMGQRVS